MRAAQVAGRKPQTQSEDLRAYRSTIPFAGGSSAQARCTTSRDSAVWGGRQLHRKIFRLALDGGAQLALWWRAELHRTDQLMVAITVSVRRTVCAFGHHERSRTLARLDTAAGSYVSQCSHCGVSMRRVAPKDWVVDRPAVARKRGGRRRSVAIRFCGVVGAVAIGLVAGMASVDSIESARANGLMGGRPAEQLAPLPSTSTDEELERGALMAGVLKVKTIGGCRQIAAELRRGCLRHVQALQWQ